MRLGSSRCRCPGLPPELAGLRIAHLADFHLGVPSPGTRAVERAADWVAERQPDLVVVSGDLLARPSGAARLRALIERLPPVYAVLGNHDFADTPRPVLEAGRRGRPRARDAAARRGGDARAARPARPARRRRPALVHARARRGRGSSPTRTADLRILLCHFPRVVDLLPEGVFDLVLSGHMHDGQICLPYPVREGAARAPVDAVQPRALPARRPGCSTSRPGSGTTFLPFRFFARPEATELVLDCG